MVLGKNIKTFLAVEDIILRPETILKKFKVSADGADFYFAIQRTYRELRENPNSHKGVKEDIDKAVYWALEQIICLTEQFMDTFEYDNLKHPKAVILLFDPKRKLNIFKGLESKGKQLTLTSLFKGIDKFRRYVLQQGQTGPVGRRYTDQKFYYIAFLMSLIHKNIVELDLMKMFETLKDRSILNQIRPMVDELTWESKRILLEELKAKVYPPALSTKALKKLKPE